MQRHALPFSFSVDERKLMTRFVVNNSSFLLLIE